MILKNTEILNNEIQPWHSLGGVENICDLRKSSMVLYGIFTELARYIYRDTQGRLLGTPDIIWKPSGTDIWIDNELRWEDQHPEVRPAIYIHLAPLQFTSVLPEQQTRFTPVDEQGVRHYEQKATGAVTFMHVASTVGEACSLADNTEYKLSLMQDIIQDDFCFLDFQTQGRTPLEKLPAEASDKFASGVTFGFEFAHAWDVKEETPILKFISNNIKKENSDRQQTISRDNIFTESKVSSVSR